VAIEVVACPNCGQKLAIEEYVGVGAQVACANVGCNTSLKITQRKPLKVEKVPLKGTLNADCRPGSYG